MLVIDASAAVDLVLSSSRTPALRHLIRGETLCSPHLIYGEALSAIRRLERWGTISSAEANSAVTRMGDFPVRTLWSADWIDCAWSRREWLQISDAVYVAAAERLRVPLLTTDKRLARALTDRAIPVISV